jgi:selenocysteine lyase/cysteine desulfurase
VSDSAEVTSVPIGYLTQFDEGPGYLDFARVGPPSRIVRDTTAALLHQVGTADVGTVDELMRQELRAKSVIARLAGSDVGHVVLLPNTSLGLFQAAFGTPPGSDVLSSASEFPANTYPWARAAEVGRITLRHIESGPFTPDRVADALTPTTALVALSAVDFRTGYRADLAALRDVVGDRLLVVDGIQGFGVTEEPWDAADVLVVGGQKWLRAGWGTGFAVLSDRALDRMEPVLSGWTGAVDADVFDDEIHPPDPAAAGWSITNLSPVTSGALAAALELVEDVGVAPIAGRIAERVGELEDTLLSCGAHIVSETGRRAGILAFATPTHPAPAVGAALATAGVTATVRREHVRLSPHATSSEEVCLQVRSALESMLG